jgi:AmmeMemoRadiSam system protein A
MGVVMDLIVSEPAQNLLLALARRTLIDCTSGRALPHLGSSEMPDEVAPLRACFTTLTRGGVLRGCIGQLRATQPLWRAVIDSTAGAAMRDPRFAAVRSEEVGEIKIEVSVLGQASGLEYSTPGELLNKIRPGIDGLVLNCGSRTSTFLPKVWEKLPDPVSFLEQLSLKAGLDKDAWQREDALISVYETQEFGER